MARTLRKSRRANLAISALIALSLSYGVVRQAYISTIERLPQPITVNLPDAWPDSSIADLRRTIQRDGTHVDPRKSLLPRDFKALNLRLPLNPNPYVAAGNLALVEGSQSKALEHYRTALHYDPRSTVVHARIAQIHLGSGDFESATDEIFAGAEYGGQVTTALMRMLLNIGDQSAVRDSIMRSVRKEPRRAQIFFRYLEPAEAHRPLPRQMLDEFVPSLRLANQYIPVLVNRGYPEEAIRLAKVLDLLPKRGPLIWPQNGDFAQSLSGGSFNWRNTSSRYGRATRVQSDRASVKYALHVTTSGRGKEILLEQTTVLTAANHQWLIPYDKISSRGSTAALRWVVTCSDGKIAGQTELTADSPPSGTMALQASIPQGPQCAAQSFRLEATGQNYRDELEVRFSSFVYVSAGNPQ